MLPPIEAYQVQHLPIVQAYEDKIGLVEVINQLVSTEVAIDPGTIVLGMILDTLSGRSPLYRFGRVFYPPRYDPAVGQGRRAERL